MTNPVAPPPELDERPLSDACCSDWLPESEKVNAPIILAQARNPHLTHTPAFAFKGWKFCPWCGASRITLPPAVSRADVEAAIDHVENRAIAFRAVGGIGNANALVAARAALLALYSRAPVGREGE